MRVYAHRGASGLAPENTTEAFELARRLGADGIELDVQVCASGEVVVFHDPDLRRLGDPRRVDALALRELRALCRAGGAPLALLEEAYEAAGPELTVNVELKVENARPTGLEAAAAAVVRRLGAGGRTLFSSFHPASLWRAFRVAPGIPRALLFGHGQSPALRRAWHRFVTPVSLLHPEHVLVDARRLSRWHARGLTVNAWTVNDPARVRALAVLGVDGVITDRPDLARDALMGLLRSPGRACP